MSNQTPAKATIKVTSSKIYERYLDVFGALLKLYDVSDFTPRERQILSKFMRIQAEELTSLPHLVFSANMRKQVAKEVGISVSALNNYIQTLLSKKVLKRENDTIFVHPKVFPAIKDGQVTFEFCLIVEN
jgi:hypothetical protein